MISKECVEEILNKDTKVRLDPKKIHLKVYSVVFYSNEPGVDTTIFDSRHFGNMGDAEQYAEYYGSTNQTYSIETSYAINLNLGMERRLRERRGVDSSELKIIPERAYYIYRQAMLAALQPQL